MNIESIFSRVLLSTIFWAGLLIPHNASVALAEC